jgi:hypothetical protein
VSLSHADLVERARRWLVTTRRCEVVITEMSSGAGSTPDALGWHGRRSILVEAKASYSDWRRDGHKPSRRAGREVGVERWYVVSEALGKRLAAEDLGGWGLLVVADRRGSAARRLRPSTEFKSDAYQEIAMLVSALRRHTWRTPGRPEGINCRLYDPAIRGNVVGDGRATLGVMRPIAAPVTPGELLERDRVWCQALASEDLDVVERVATRFNELRPDPQRGEPSAEHNGQ